MPARLDFKQLAQDIDITDVARLLGVKLSKDMRAECCDSDRALQIYPETNSFCCHSSKTAGDCISMYAHLKGFQGMYRAAKELSDHFQTAVAAGSGTAPTAEKREPTRQLLTGAGKKSEPFDAEKFASKLTFTEEVEKLGITEADAERFSIGFHRGRVYFPVRDETGFVCGFIGWSQEGLKLPPQWLEQNKVVKLKRA